MKAHSLGAILCAFVFGCLVWVVACSGRTIDSVSDDGSSGGSDDAGASWTDAPRFGLPSGRYETPQPITITSNTPDATIHYTVDDSPPSTASPIYEKPILVGYGTTTIRAIATAEGHLDSQITWATYTIEAAPLPKVAAPVFAPPPGSYEAPLSVSISTSTPGATIHYTVDDTGPDLGSPVYEGAILLKDGVFHIKAFAVANGYDDSTVSTATYDVEEEFCNYSAPTFVPPGGHLWNTAARLDIDLHDRRRDFLHPRWNGTNEELDEVRGADLGRRGHHHQGGEHPRRRSVL